MGIALGSNFDVQTNLPLDSRAVVADITARDAISSLRRYEGMSVYVIATQKEYTLKGGITNAEWTEAMAQGVTVVNTATDRDAITLISRYEGMLVYVKDSKITYQMTSGALTNDGWTYYYGVTASDDVGEIITSARDLTDPHEGTLPCDGATLYDATLYPTLAAKFWNSTQSKWKFGGTGTYPTGQFRTPNFKGAFIRGADLGAGRDPDAASRTASGTNGVTGDAVGSYQDEAFKSHTHIQDAHNHTQNPHTHSMNQLADTVGTTGAIGTRVNVSFDQYTNATTATNNPTTATNQNTGGSETRPKNIAVNFFVRYKPSTRGPKGDTGNAINVVADDTARLAIPAGDRFDGYLAYVQSTKKNWQLQGGIANANWVEIADVSSNQAITNKDIDGGTASNLSRITLPKAAKTTLDGLTRKQGTLFYDTTTNKPYYDDGTFLKVIGSGSGGSINFISGGDAESGTTGITPYNEGSSASRPSAGTGIAPTGITIGTDSTNPLSGTNSFILSKSAVNARGQGYSWSFTIDRAYQAKVLKIEMDYVVSSGSFVAGSPTTDSDLIVYIIDVDSGKAIEPSSFKLLSKSTTISDRFSATFQTSATSLNYRLCLHVANNTTNTWQIKFDNLAVSPTVALNISTNGPVGSIIATGSLTPPAGYLYADGTAVSRSAYSELFKVIGTTYGTGDGSTTFNLPDLRGVFARGAGSQTIGAETYSATLGQKQNDATSKNGLALTDPGHSHQYDMSGSGNSNSLWHPNPNNGWGSNSFASALYNDSLYGRFSDHIISSGSNVSLNNGDAETRPANVAVAYHICFNAGSVQVSDGYDGRVIAANVFRATGTASQSIPNAIYTGVGFDNKNFDTTSNWVTSATGGSSYFVVPSAGYYRVAASITFSGNATNGRVLAISKGSAAGVVERIATSAGIAAAVTLSGSRTIYANAGELIFIAVYQDSGVSLNLAQLWNEASIEKLAGNPVISATETVACNVSLAATTSIGTSATQITGFGTPTDTTHGAFSNNEFTAPISGRYFIDADIMFFINTVSVADIIDLHIRKNGTVVKYGRSPKIANQNYQNIKTSLELRLNAGDKITFSASRGTGLTAVDSHPDTQASQISIFKIGN